MTASTPASRKGLTSKTWTWRLNAKTSAVCRTADVGAASGPFG
jgi:hypothetical protein